MDYFEALKTSATEDPKFYAHSPVPPPGANDIGGIINFIKRTCDDLYFTSDSDEPVEVYQLSAVGLHSLEADVDKLTLPSAHDFAVFITGDVSASEEGFVAEKLPIDRFFDKLQLQQLTERQKRLAASLADTFSREASTPGTSAAYYRVGIPPNIELYVVMLIDGQIVGIKTLSVET
ncbi:hypothetical protein GQ54DRAFT_259407 [Martensiomyces pterosporus]|nr:hypothetical protein GQ54DRAFT_259407 [Martensiomyces pterosporus]